jgi:hypothetical protein
MEQGGRKEKNVCLCCRSEERKEKAKTDLSFPRYSRLCFFLSFPTMR